jgi:hypothetical protein
MLLWLEAAESSLASSYPPIFKVCGPKRLRTMIADAAPLSLS